jgi:hypothetical protein
VKFTFNNSSSNLNAYYYCSALSPGYVAGNTAFNITNSIKGLETGIKTFVTKLIRDFEVFIFDKLSFT